MASTTNYSWTTPDDTSLVKDGAAAIRSLGSAIDTTTKALNPSTTLGDIEYRSSTANTNTRLGIGSNGQVLTVSGGVPAWATSTSGGMTLLASSSFSGDTTLSSISSSYTNLQLVLTDVATSDSSDVDLRINGETGSVYQAGAASGSSGNPFTTQWNGPLSFSTSSNNGSVNVTLLNYADTSFNKSGLRYDFDTPTGSTTSSSQIRLLNSNITAAISSITLYSSSGGTISGNYKLYGVK